MSPMIHYRLSMCQDSNGWIWAPCTSHLLELNFMVFSLMEIYLVLKENSPVPFFLLLTPEHGAQSNFLIQIYFAPIQSKVL